MEECQLSECGGEEELGGGESPLPRSSSTSDITQQLADHFPGRNSVKINPLLGAIEIFFFSSIELSILFKFEEEV